jgi:nicotinamide-nucleotide amidase
MKMKRAKRKLRPTSTATAPAQSGQDSGRLLAQQVGAALKGHGMTLVTAESCTGGGVAQAVTMISGSSAWFDRGFVTYSNTAKEEMLGVSPDTLEQHGAVSEQTVREMVDGALQYSSGQVALSVSGIAGPTGGTPEKPVGMVWFAWGTKNGVQAVCHNLPGDRDAVRAKSVQIALQGVLNLLNGIIITA